MIVHRVTAIELSNNGDNGLERFNLHNTPRNYIILQPHAEQTSSTAISEEKAVDVFFFRIHCSSRAGLLRAKTHSGGANPILDMGGGEPAHRRNLLIAHPHDYPWVSSKPDECAKSHR